MTVNVPIQQCMSDAFWLVGRLVVHNTSSYFKPRAIASLGKVQLAPQNESRKLIFEGGKYVDFSLLALESACDSSPSERTLRHWLLDWEIENYLIHSQLVEKAPIFTQSDGGQKGQEVRLIYVWNDEKSTAQNQALPGF
jgi:hypothetical protein